MKVYFTDQWHRRRYRGERFIYHVMRYCPAGRRIKRKHRRSADLPLHGRVPCAECTALAQRWVALPGSRRVAL